MNILSRKVQHPGVALFIFFLIGAVLAKYGIVPGTALLISLFAGVAIYKMVTV